jgi:hypothetical protein
MAGMRIGVVRSCFEELLIESHGSPHSYPQHRRVLRDMECFHDNDEGHGYFATALAGIQPFLYRTMRIAARISAAAVPVAYTVARLRALLG